MSTKNTTEELGYERTPCTLLFNALTGEHFTTVGLSREQYGEVDASKFIVRYEDVNIFNDEVTGNIIINSDGSYKDNYKILAPNKAPDKVYERALNRSAEQKITTKYPLAKQVSIIAEAVETLAEKAGVELGELSEMLSYIKLCLRTNQIRKGIYRDNPDVVYITDEDCDNLEARRLAGGVAEEIGARTPAIGRIFGSDG